MFSVRTGRSSRSSRKIACDVGHEAAAGRVRRAAARVLPVAGHAGQRVQQPDRVAAAGVALHAHRAADPGRPRRRDAPAELDDPLLGEAGQRRHAVGRELEDALAERLPADGVRGQVLVVLRAHVDDHPQQSERERGVGAGQRRQMLVGALGGARAQRVDRHHVRAALAAPPARTSTGGGRSSACSCPTAGSGWTRRTSPGPSRRRSRSCSGRPCVPATEQIVILWRDAPSTFHSRCPARPSSPWM